MNIPNYTSSVGTGYVKCTYNDFYRPKSKPRCKEIYKNPTSPLLKQHNSDSLPQYSLPVARQCDEDFGVHLSN